jgi:Phosphotransferase enzyme family
VSEEQLAPAFGDDPGVVRVGDTVRRGRQPWSPAVRGLLLHLERSGFDGAPRHLGTDEQGREVLSFVDGRAPAPPYPRWAMTDEALAAMGRLLRRFHRASAGMGADDAAGWARLWSDPRGGPVVCHNDPFPENTVFRDGVPVALIDFDMAAPGRPLWDVAIVAHVWCPLGDPAVATDTPPGLDAIARLRLLASAYGVDRGQAPELVRCIFEERAQSLSRIREEVASGDPGWVERWREMGGERRVAADDAWLAAHRHAMLDALRADA